MPRVSVIIPAYNAEAHLDEEQLLALAVAGTRSGGPLTRAYLRRKPRFAAFDI
jgi:hypothetical protein